MRGILNQFYLHNDQKEPEGRDVNRYPHEGIAGPRPEGTGTAHTAERTRQPTTLAALDEDEQDEEQVDQQNQEIKQVRPPGNIHRRDSLHQTETGLPVPIKQPL